MTDYRRAIIVVTQSDRLQANLDVEAVVPDSGPHTLQVGLVPRGSPPGTQVTHWICSWLVSNSTLRMLRTVFGQPNVLDRKLSLGVALDAPRVIDGERERHADEFLDELALEPARLPIRELID